MIDREDRGSVAVLRIEHGKVGAIDIELLDELESLLAELENSDTTALVLTGSGANFSAGLDLRRILQGGDKYVHELFAAFRRGIARLFTLPLPVVAAVNGHAIAGGCVLACCCDRRLMADGDGRIGFPQLGVPLQYPALAIGVVGAATGLNTDDLLHRSPPLSPAQALDVGLVDAIESSTRLVKRACDLAEELTLAGGRAFAEQKKSVRQPVLARAAADVEHDAAVDRAWADPKLHAVIGEYLIEKTGRG
jgi:enoyl-CoA hydratase